MYCDFCVESAKDDDTVEETQPVAAAVKGRPPVLKTCCACDSADASVFSECHICHRSCHAPSMCCLVFFTTELQVVCDSCLKDGSGSDSDGAPSSLFGEEHGESLSFGLRVAPSQQNVPEAQQNVPGSTPQTSALIGDDRTPCIPTPVPLTYKDAAVQRMFMHDRIEYDGRTGFVFDVSTHGFASVAWDKTASHEACWSIMSETLEWTPAPASISQDCINFVFRSSRGDKLPFGWLCGPSLDTREGWHVAFTYEPAVPVTGFSPVAEESLRFSTRAGEHVTYDTTRIAWLRKEGDKLIPAVGEAHIYAFVAGYSNNVRLCPPPHPLHHPPCTM